MVMEWQKHITLTLLPLDKMAIISQVTFSNAFSWMKKFNSWQKFHCLLCPIDNNLFGAKPLNEPMLTWFIDAYMRH